MGEREYAEHSHTERDPQPVAGGPVAVVMTMLQHAVRDPDELAGIVRSFPHARDDIFNLLHQTLGNGFVREVVARLEPPKRETLVETGGDAKSVAPEDLQCVITSAAPQAKAPDVAPEEAPHDDGLIGAKVHARGHELHDPSHDSWLHDTSDVSSVFPAKLAGLYDDCLAHAKDGTLVFPSPKDPPGKTSVPFVRFIDAFYGHFHCREKRINVEILKKGGDKAYFIRDYLESQLGDVLPAHASTKPIRVHRKAEAAFLEMHEAAKRDGVPLKVVSGYRPPPRPDKAVSKNPMAKATNSSHNYGLALDFQLSVDHLHVKETNTHDVDNLLAYYGSSVTKWLVMNAARFDFHPYSKEPWHYEYNPDGMAEEIIAGAKAAST